MNRFQVSFQKDCLIVRENNNSSSLLILSDNGYELLVRSEHVSNVQFGDSFYCDGILGLYKLSREIYVAFITESVAIGMGVSGHPIYRIGSVKLVKLPSIENSSANMYYLEMIQEVYNTTKLYYSNYEDLTRRLQSTRCEPLKEEDHLFPTSMDSSFMFNYPIIQSFAPFRSLLLRDLIPITIFGFVRIIPSIAINDVSFSLMLISRRSIHRLGRRYNTRGVDSEGHVANYVETEQIVCQRSGIVTSFVQIRGSIPLEWSQFPNLKYTPAIRVYGETTFLDIHFLNLLKQYNDVIVVNLIDKKKDQLMIGTEYERACTEFNNHYSHLNYFWFDFHSECKNMHYERLSKLMDMTRNCVSKGEFFKYDLKKKSLISTQNSVIRTNCIDCLDRTNVVQSMYAKWMLFRQLFGEKGDSIMNECLLGIEHLFTLSNQASKHEIVSLFNNLWSDNADEMSLLYSGSRSLKTDYTRTGKRTIKGSIDDLVNSVIRYFKNNFCDGYFEDCLSITFNMVQMGPNTDRRVKRLSRSSFMMFFLLVILPLLSVAFVISYIVSSDNFNMVFHSLSLCFLLIAGYVFVNKGSYLGGLFLIAQKILPLKLSDGSKP